MQKQNLSFSSEKEMKCRKRLLLHHFSILKYTILNRKTVLLVCWQLVDEEGESFPIAGCQSLFQFHFQKSESSIHKIRSKVFRM